MRASRRGEIADECADQAAFVDPLVLIKASVLGRDKCLLHALREVRERHPYPPLVLLEHFCKAFSLAIEHDARARKLHAVELGVIRQISSRLVVEIDHRAEIDRQHHDLLILTELAVRRLQIDKIDPSEHLVLADRLWVVQGGCNQILKVDVLDIEGPAHMRAARVQQLRDLLLVPHAIKARLHT